MAKIKIHTDKNGARLGYNMGKYYLIKVKRGWWIINTTGEKYLTKSDYARAMKNGEIVNRGLGGVQIGLKRLKELYAKEEQE